MLKLSHTLEYVPLNDDAKPSSLSEYPEFVRDLLFVIMAFGFVFRITFIVVKSTDLFSIVTDCNRIIISSHVPVLRVYKVYIYICM